MFVGQVIGKRANLRGENNLIGRQKAQVGPSIPAHQRDVEKE
jgi:hypothetical protein